MTRFRDDQKPQDEESEARDDCGPECEVYWALPPLEASQAWRAGSMRLCLVWPAVPASTEVVHRLYRSGVFELTRRELLSTVLRGGPLYSTEMSYMDATAWFSEHHDGLLGAEVALETLGADGWGRIHPPVWP